MKRSFYPFLAVILLGGFSASCRDVQETAGVGLEPEVTNERRSPRESRKRGASRLERMPASSSDPRIDEMMAQLSQVKEPRSKRDLFSQILVELSPEEHDLALELVVDDLSAPVSVNLLLEYLEMSSMMSPALQLPGIVRMLKEDCLSSLQRAAMEHLLREELGLSTDEVVQDWQPRVEAHLRELPGVIFD